MASTFEVEATLSLSYRYQVYADDIDEARAAATKMFEKAAPVFSELSISVWLPDAYEHDDD